MFSHDYKTYLGRKSSDYINIDCKKRICFYLTNVTDRVSSILSKNNDNI